MISIFWNYWNKNYVKLENNESLQKHLFNWTGLSGTPDLHCRIDTRLARSRMCPRVSGGSRPGMCGGAFVPFPWKTEMKTWRLRKRKIKKHGIPRTPDLNGWPDNPAQQQTLFDSVKLHFSKKVQKFLLWPETNQQKTTKL